jgi:signal transduction histidine kinase
MSSAAAAIGSEFAPRAEVQASAVHSTTLERAYGRIVGVAALFYLFQFWFSSLTVTGQTAGSAAADFALSVPLIGLAVVWVLRRPPLQRELDWLAAAAAVLLPLSRVLAVPHSPFADQVAYLLVASVVDAWAVFSRRLVVLVPVVLTLLATGAWHPAGDLPVEQTVATLAIAAFAGVAGRMMRDGARQADQEAAKLAQQIAEQDAATAAEQAAQRAKSTVHDDVLSVLRAIGGTDQRLPWNVLIAKAGQARQALAGQLRAGSTTDLPSLLRHEASQLAQELAVHAELSLDQDLELPASHADAIRAAVAEALRNTARHAGVTSALITARSTAAGAVVVTVSDSGAGFDPARIAPERLGVRESILARLRAAGGTAEIVSAPGQGTTVILTLPPAPAEPADADPVAMDQFDWVRLLAPPPPRVFLGFMLPPLLSSLVSLCLRWGDLRWPAVAVAAFAGLFILTATSAGNVSRAEMTKLTAAAQIFALTAFTAAGALAVAPGTTDAFAYWISGESAVLITVLYFVRGPVFGLTAMALDLGALLVGLSVTGTAIPHGAWLSILASPVLGAGLGLGFRLAFGGLSRYAERQLAEYRDRQRALARAEAVSRVDSAALETARRIAGPIIDRVAAGEPRTPALRTAARLAGGTLRDELLAPDFLSAELAEQVRTARTTGVTVTVDVAREHASPLAREAKKLLAAALANLNAVTDVRLQLHAPVGVHPAALMLHVRGNLPDDTALRAYARECGALVSDLNDHGLLVWLHARPCP